MTGYPTSIGSSDESSIRVLGQDLSQDLIAVERGDGEPVGTGDPVRVVGGDQARGAGHVLHDDGRLARNVLREMAGEQPRVGIEAAARRVADDDPHRLACVGLAGRLARRGESADAQDHESQPSEARTRPSQRSASSHPSLGVFGPRGHLAAPIPSIPRAC